MEGEVVLRVMVKGESYRSEIFRKSWRLMRGSAVRLLASFWVRSSTLPFPARRELGEVR